MAATTEAIEAANVAAQAALDKLATDPVAIDVTEHMALTDVFVVCSADNEPQVNAIVDHVEHKMLLAGHRLKRREGKAQGRWVLLDFGDVIAHVFHSEEREFYSLEKLWGDCPRVALSLDESV